MHSLTRQSQQLKEAADSIMRQTHLLKQFESLGAIFFVGGYELGVMYRRDIDFYIQTRTYNSTQVKNITKQLIDSEKFQTVALADWTEHKPPTNIDIQGYYWQLVYYQDQTPWKFDIWYTTQTELQAVKDTQSIKQKLAKNPEAKEEILKLKQKYFNGQKYINNLTGMDIYMQILGKDVLK